MRHSFLHAAMDAEHFRACSDYAVKSGNPRWLWPEIAVEEWRAVAETIEETASDVLLNGRSRVHLAGDAAAISVAAFTTGMGPLLGHWLGEARLSASEDAAAVLAHHLAHNEERMEKMAAYAAHVVDHLTRDGIEVTVLKGMHTAFAYFPSPATRPMSDIDILIAPADEAAASVILRDLGFRHCGSRGYHGQTWRIPDEPAAPKSLYFVHKDGPWTIDLHVTPNLKATWAATPVKLEFGTLRPGPRWALSPAAHALEQPRLLMHLAAHAGVHLLSLTLLRLTELVLVIRKDVVEGSLSWDELHLAAERAGALGALYPAFHYCEQLAPGTVPPAVGRACRDKAPPGVVRLVESLTPASANGMLRCSVEERFMWLPSRAAVARQLFHDLLPLKRSWPEVLRMYRMLGWRVLKRTVSR